MSRTTHGDTGTVEHNTWHTMRQRCEDPNRSGYERYGARGIRVCERWQKYENFIADMGRRPSADHSIERIDNEKGYSPENCKWATRVEQAANRYTSKPVTFGGKTMTLAAWERELGAKRGFLRDRVVLSGWSVEKAITTPPLPRGKWGQWGKRKIDGEWRAA